MAGRINAVVSVNTEDYAVPPPEFGFFSGDLGVRLQGTETK